MRPILLLAYAGVALGALAAARAGGTARAERPFHRAEMIFPLDYLHNHGSCVVETPGGDLLACWYRGSGERRADDVRILGARLRRGSSRWSEPFEMADTPGFPDCNPCMVVDPRSRLWLFWPMIVANEWHTAILMSKTADRIGTSGPIRWTRERPIMLKPGPEFARVVEESVQRDLARLDALPEADRERAREYLELRRKNGADRYFSRMGWMPRAHPVILDGKRMILPLYSDGYDFSLMAITDDWGENWRTSLPLVGDGPVQPSIAARSDGTLVTYMRDNGRPPKRLLTSESRDGGETWSPVRDTPILNPGAGSEVVRLRNGHWALVNNDTERGRHSLAISISEDEGRTWRWTRHLELDTTAEGPRTAGYPSLVQARDGTLHVTYTYTAGAREVQTDAQGRALRECIKHAHFNEAWVRQGDGN